MNNTPPRSHWFEPRVHADRRPFLLGRQELITALRRHFLDLGFLEVETSALQVSPGNETHLHALAADVRAPDGRRDRRYLRTSPEFALKKLLAAGETRLFEFARVFRDRERGVLHATEFTMLEWYRAGEAYDRLMEDCAALLRLAAETTGVSTWRHRGRSVDPLVEPERLSVAEAFERFAAIDLLSTIDGAAGVRELLAAAIAKASTRASIGVTVAADDSWSDLFSKVMVGCVEPRLGNGRATILDRYPIVEAALARPSAGDPRVAERFELYAAGVELANAFGELTDPVEQRARFEADMAEKLRIHGECYPIDESFIAALALMPQSSGIALGFDRLVMLATGAPSVAHCQWDPWQGV